MREEVRDVERLKHILDAAKVLAEYPSRHTLEEAQSDPVVYFGLMKHAEIIGEAVYKLTKDFRSEHNEIEWDDIERMRRVLVHGYYKILPMQLWETITTDIPALMPLIERMIAEKETESSPTLSR